MLRCFLSGLLHLNILDTHPQQFISRIADDCAVRRVDIAKTSIEVKRDESVHSAGQDSLVAFRFSSKCLLSLLVLGDILMKGDPYSAEFRMIKGRDDRMTPKAVAIFLDVVDLAGPRSGFVQTVDDRVGSFLGTRLVSGIDHSDALADKFAGVIAEHALKWGGYKRGSRHPSGGSR